MKIIGNGVDIVDNFRIKKAIKNKKFIDRLFTNEEIKCSLKKNINRSNYFAKRFAAKEAFVKAIGTGFSKDINFKDIHIKNNPSGTPEIYVNTKLKKKIKKKFKISKFKSYLSLTDEKNHSISFVIISGS